MRYYLLFLVASLVACGGADLLPEADVPGLDVIVTDWGQPDEGGDEETDPGADEGQDVTDAQEEDAGEDVPAVDTGIEDLGADEGEDAQEDAVEDVEADVGDGEPCSWLFNVCWKTTQCTDPECFEEDCVALLSDDATAAWRAIEDCTAAYCAKHPYYACRDEAWNFDCSSLIQACLDDVD